MMTIEELTQLVKKLQQDMKAMNRKHEKDIKAMSEKYDKDNKKLKDDLEQVRSELAKIQARDLYSAFCQLFCKKLGGYYEADIERNPGHVVRQELDMTSVKYIERLITYVEEKLAVNDAAMKQKYGEFAEELGSDPLQVAKYCAKISSDNIFNAMAHPLLTFLTDKNKRTKKAKKKALDAIETLTPTSGANAKVILDYIIKADAEISSNFTPAKLAEQSQSPHTPNVPGVVTRTQKRRKLQ
jgi:hypothetical protein